MSAIASQSRRPFTPTLREGLAARPSQFARSTCFEAGHLTSVNAGWRSVRPVIDAEQCTLCLNCYMYCPDGTIAKVRDDEGVCVAVVVDYEFLQGLRRVREGMPRALHRHGGRARPRERRGG